MKTLGIVFGAIALFAVAANAATVSYSATLSGPNENPVNSSPGLGSALVTYDSVANTLRVQVSFSGLTGTTNASHIHCCIAPPGATGVATTTPTFLNFPLGVTSGTYDNTLDLSLAASYNPAFITANGGTIATAEAVLLAGLNSGTSYLNIHTTAFPSGEIRGFLSVVTPEPSTFLLGGSLLSGLALAYRKRRA